MVVYNTSQHPTALVLCVCIWALDMYLILTGFRIVLSRARACWIRRVIMWLAPYTDPPLYVVRRAMAAKGFAPPLWLPYILVLLVGTTLHHTLLKAVSHFH